jgi:hypothetical protein
MADLNLTKQGDEYTVIKPVVDKFISLLEQRSAIWSKWQNDEKTEWINNADDPLLKLGYETLTKLHDIFGKKFISQLGKIKNAL